MPSPSTPTRIATHIGLTIGGGSAGWLTTLAVVHKPQLAAIAAGTVIAAVVANLAESACRMLPEIIKAAAQATVDVIGAAAEALALIMRTRTRNRLLRAGIDAEKTSQALDMLAQQAADADLPEGRRVNDAALVSLVRFLVNSRARGGGGKPRSDPRKPRNDPPNPKNGTRDNVIPMRPVN
jgi:hypothetical protein